jgi:hypothetical protein
MPFTSQLQTVKKSLNISHLILELELRIVIKIKDFSHLQDLIQLKISYGIGMIGMFEVHGKYIDFCFSISCLVPVPCVGLLIVILHSLVFTCSRYCGYHLFLYHGSGIIEMKEATRAGLMVQGIIRGIILRNALSENNVYEWTLHYRTCCELSSRYIYT